MTKLRSTLAIAAMLGFGAAAVAQPTGYTGPGSQPQAQAQAPAQAGYTGPSSIQVMSVKQLLDEGKDDQHARLQGRIVSYDGGERYTFEDDTGRITVEIDDKDFPRGQAISAEQRVELLGELDKGRNKVEFEVDRLTVIP